MEKNAKIYVAGHRGLVGSAIWKNLQDKGYTNLVGRTHKELDLLDGTAVRNFFDEEPDLFGFCLLSGRVQCKRGLAVRGIAADVDEVSRLRPEVFVELGKLPRQEVRLDGWIVPPVEIFQGLRHIHGSDARLVDHDAVDLIQRRADLVFVLRVEHCAGCVLEQLQAGLAPQDTAILADIGGGRCDRDDLADQVGVGFSGPVEHRHGIDRTSLASQRTDRIEDRPILADRKIVLLDRLHHDRDAARIDDHRAEDGGLCADQRVLLAGHHTNSTPLRSTRPVLSAGAARWSCASSSGFS